MAQGKALKVQVAYLVADIVNVGGILTCDVITMTICARSLSIVMVSLMISDSECSSNLVPFGQRIGSYGSTSMLEVGSCVSVPFLTCCVSSLGRLVLLTVGSCVSTLGLVTLVIVCDIGKKDMDVDDEGTLVTSIILPLPLSMRAGSCVSTF